VPDHAPAVQHQRLQALLGQFLRGPTARDPGTDDDRIIGIVLRHPYLSPSNSKDCADILLRLPQEIAAHAAWENLQSLVKKT
jgi:hypothetical protein